jgi:NADH-quinone oxidoreductase subunit C
VTTPEQLGARVCARIPAAAATVEFGQLAIDVPAEDWPDAARFVHDDPEVDCRFFDWLSAYDDLDAGLAVAVHAWSTTHRHEVLLRTRVARADGRLPTLVGVWPGAAWHERETYEMFGIVFDGHPNLTPLLLPDGFEGHPLRKEFVLASRVAKAWPGEKEPGESDRDVEGAPAHGRRRILAPGVPSPDDWGPDARRDEAP